MKFYALRRFPKKVAANPPANLIHISIAEFHEKLNTYLNYKNKHSFTALPNHTKQLQNKYHQNKHPFAAFPIPNKPNIYQLHNPQNKRSFANTKITHNTNTSHNFETPKTTITKFLLDFPQNYDFKIPKDIKLQLPNFCNTSPKILLQINITFYVFATFPTKLRLQNP